MIVVYGAYRHAVNTTGVTVASDITENEAGVPIDVNVSVNLEGRLRNPDPSKPWLLDSMIHEMQQAYSLPGQDFGLLHNDGRRSAVFWRNADTIGGIRPKMLSYPNYQGGEYCTYRKFTISLNLKTPFGAKALKYLKFSESLSIEGGGSLYGVKEVNFGPPVRQRLRTHTKCTATQSGTAVGRDDYPPIPPPIWPNALKSDEPKINKIFRPQGSSQTGKIRLAECEISWVWEYESPFRLSGIPHYATG